MVGIALLIQAAELTGWTTLWLKLRDKQQKQMLMFGKPRPQQIPLVDSQLKKLAGNPNKLAKNAAARVTKLVRRAVNTQAFEYVVTGLLNSKSGLRSQLKTPSIVRIL